jgi:hypothetical protein
MEQLARLAPAREPQEAYMRYRQWLPFAYRCDRATSAVSQDLDYQPLNQMVRARSEACWIRRVND